MTAVRRVVGCSSALIGLAVAAACANSSTQVASVGSAPEEEAALVEALVNRQAIASYPEDYWPSFNDLFPSSGQSEVLESAFLADVERVEPGLAYASSADGQIELASFEDERAEWRTFRVDVRVTETFAGDVEAGEQVALGFAFGSSLEQSVVEDGFTSMGQIVAFTEHGKTASGDPSLVPVLANAAFVSPVDGQSVLFPALQAGGVGQPELAARFDTLEELRSVEARG